MLFATSNLGFAEGVLAGILALILFAIFVLTIAAIAIKIDRSRRGKQDNNVKINNDNTTNNPSDYNYTIDDWAKTENNPNYYNYPANEWVNKAYKRPSKFKSFMNSKKTLVIALTVLVIVVMYQLGYRPSSFSNPSIPTVSMPSYALSTFDFSSLLSPSIKNAVPFPEHGTMVTKTALNRVAPLSITTPNDGFLYYIKLKNNDNRNNDIDLYLHSNTTTEILVPFGTYKLFYAFGYTWYGEEELFGWSTNYRVTNTDLTFYNDIENKSYNGHIITLKVVGGNIDTDYTNKSEFQS